ncbi:hypothetical protein TEA_018732 [Camellia sinensis var. sinensis]|uniref:Ubiquitin-like domain-containing protein n=1 Tax=Camellia sinensis var. sinensis TaxID=542762 RepID=A0A4S4EME1_CAMSN|nr:hypothetical protein TEA_018732 [Camellia sinensis var. sinensis]
MGPRYKPARVAQWVREENLGSGSLLLLEVPSSNPTPHGLLCGPLEEGNEVYFRIKRNTQLRKLMTAYCDRQSLDPKSIVFLFDGRRIHAEQTPDQLGMEDCDEVDAMLHQTGGGGFGDI